MRSSLLFMEESFMALRSSVSRIPAILTLAVTILLSVPAFAATLAPAKSYVKLDEPLVIRFLDETADGKKAFETIGLPATKIDGLFKPADAASYVGGDSKPLFSLFKFDGTKLN